MIVKNESRVILRLLESILPLVDGYCICDTGSTDNTVEIIESFFKQNGLPGIIVRESFLNFGYNRSFALKACLQAQGLSENDYILLMDADMILTGPLLTNPIGFKQMLTHDVYLMMQGNDSFYYKNARIVKNKGFSYWGVTHEYLQTFPGTTYYTIEKPLLFIRDIGDGGAKADKWERDIRLLLKGIEDEPKSDRYPFYLANTYRDSGNPTKAIEYYKKRIEMGGWVEEIWNSYYSAGKCYMILNDIANALHMWLEGYQLYPNRVENIYQIIQYYRNHGKNKLSYQFYKLAKDSITRFGGASDEFLFLEKDIYEYKLDYEMTIFGYYENPDKVDLKHLSMKVLSCPLIEEGISRNILSNYKFYSEKIASFNNNNNNGNLLHKLNMIGSTQNNEGFYPSTPSLCFLNNSTLLVNKRYVNYRIDDQGNYMNQEKIITRNIFATIDLFTNSDLSTNSDVSNNSKKKEYVLEYDTSLDNLYEGLEDIRLHIGPDGQIYYNANRGLSPSNVQIEHGTIILYPHQNDNINSIYKTINNRILKSPNDRTIEKNWVLFNSEQNKLLCLYEFFPLTIGFIQDSSFIQISQQNTPPLFKYIRGSTNGLTIGDEIWFIGHVVSYESRRHYYHIIIILDKKTGALKRYTNMFTFEGQPVEYTLGFVEMGENLLIGYSISDRETKFIEVPKEWFEDRMV